MTIVKKLSLCLATLSSTALVLLAITGGVAAAAPTKLHPQPFCNDMGTGDCVTVVNNNWKTGSPVVLGSNTTREALYTIPAVFCKRGDAVSATCHPFRVSSGLDKKYKGDVMYKLHWGNAKHATCLAIDTSDDVINAKCAGSKGVIWIKTGQTYINRYATYMNKTVEVLTSSDTLGAQLTVSPYTTSNPLAEWKFQ